MNYYGESTWEEHLQQANQKSDFELAKYAMSSVYYRHRCEACYACATLTVLEKRHPALMNESETNKLRIVGALKGE